MYEHIYIYLYTNLSLSIYICGYPLAGQIHFWLILVGSGNQNPPWMEVGCSYSDGCFLFVVGHWGVIFDWVFRVQLLLWCSTGRFSVIYAVHDSCAVVTPRCTLLPRCWVNRQWTYIYTHICIYISIHMQLKGFWGRLAKAMYDTKGASTFTCMLSQMQARRRGQPIFGGSGKSIIHGPSQRVHPTMIHARRCSP